MPRSHKPRTARHDASCHTLQARGAGCQRRHEEASPQRFPAAGSEFHQRSRPRCRAAASSGGDRSNRKFRARRGGDGGEEGRASLSNGYTLAETSGKPSSKAFPTPDFFPTSHVRRPFVVSCGVELSCNRAISPLFAAHPLRHSSFFVNTSSVRLRWQRFQQAMDHLRRAFLAQSDHSMERVHGNQLEKLGSASTE